MATDVIIDPSTGQIYWNDSAGVGTESISIKGDAVNTISLTGYSGSFSPGSTPAGALTLVTIKDSAGTDALIPGTSGFNLGSSILRWNTFATNANLSGTLVVSDSTNTSSLITGSVKINGGIAISSNASIGQTLLIFNGANYSAFRSGATGNTTYTLPTTSPAIGSSVLSSTAAGVMSWVPMVASSSGAGSGTVAVPGAQYQVAAYYHSATGASVSGSTTFTNNTSTNQVAITHNTSSTSTSTGALAIGGGLGLAGNAFIGGTVTIQDSTVSASTTTGALVVTGGIGVGGKVFADVLQSSGNCAVGGNLTVAGTVDLGNATADSISFLGRVDTDIDPIATNTYDLGDSSLVWKNVSIGSSAIFYNTSNANTLGFRAGVSGASLIYVFPIDTPTAGQVLSATAPSGGVVTLSWEDDQTGAGSGTVAVPGAQFGVAYYAGTGASVSGTSLMQVLTSGTAISVFTNLDLRSQNDIRFFNSGNTFYTALQAANNSANYTLSLPTAPVGAGFSVIVTDNNGQMYFSAPGSGIAFSSATANTPLIRAKRHLNLQFSAGFTPLAAGPDNAILRIPESFSDGTSETTYHLKRFQVRVETPSAGSSRLQLERSSTDTGAFTLAASGSSHIGGFGVTITGAGIYLTSVTSFAGSFVTSGDLLRLNWTLLNATHANFSVQLLLEEV